MELSRVRERWLTPVHNGNRADAAPYRVRLALLDRGAYLGLVAAMETLAASIKDDAAGSDAVRVWSTAATAAMGCVVAVEGLTDNGEPVTVEQFRAEAAKAPELRGEIVQTLMAAARLSEDEGKA